MASRVIVLDSIASLLGAFADQSVRYVHWKSNINVDGALTGDDDLDVLVHPDDRERAEQILAHLRLHRVVTSKDRWQPNMYHYYGLDEGVGKLVHLHLHYGLTLGFDFHKNYTLPFVDWYLAGPIDRDGILVPAPEKELILFAIRTHIKHARAVDWSEFPLAQVRRLRSHRNLLDATPLKKAELVELRHLRGLSGEIELRRSYDELGLPLAFATFMRYVEELETRPDALHRNAAEVKRILKPHAENSEAVAVSRAAARLSRHRLKSVGHRLGIDTRQHRRLPTGGRIVAFIGGDGAGKSTNVAELSRVLRSALDCSTMHVGRPPRTATATALKVVSVLASRAGFEAASHTTDSLGLAHSRRAEFRRAERLRDRGSIVILDRIPHPNISTMDMPRVDPGLGRVHLACSRLERRWYGDIGGVDLLVVLRLDPEMALERRPADDAEQLRRRSGEVWNGTWNDPGSLIVDTGEADLESVRREVLCRVWACMTTRPARTELVGLSGVGKSTSVVRHPSRVVHTPSSTLRYRSYPGLVALACLEELLSHGVPTNREQVRIAQALAQFRWFIHFGRKKAHRPQELWRSYVLDQGPVFQLALGIYEGRIHPGSRLMREAVSAIDHWFTRPVLHLDAPDHILIDRVRNRAQATRSAQLDDGLARDFYARYRKAIDTAMEPLDHVATISTVRPVSEVAADVQALLRQDVDEA